MDGRVCNGRWHRSTKRPATKPSKIKEAINKNTHVVVPFKIINGTFNIIQFPWMMNWILLYAAYQFFDSNIDKLVWYIISKGEYLLTAPDRVYSRQKQITCKYSLQCSILNQTIRTLTWELDRISYYLPTYLPSSLSYKQVLIDIDTGNCVGISDPDEDCLLCEIKIVWVSGMPIFLSVWRDPLPLGKEAKR